MEAVIEVLDLPSEFDMYALHVASDLLIILIPGNVWARIALSPTCYFIILSTFRHLEITLRFGIWRSRCKRMSEINDDADGSLLSVRIAQQAYW